MQPAGRDLDAVGVQKVDEAIPPPRQPRFLLLPTKGGQREVLQTRVPFRVLSAVPYYFGGPKTGPEFRRTTHY